MTPPVTVIPQNEPRASTDLDMVVDQLSATRARSLSPLTDGVRDRSGAAGIGYLATAVDVTAAMVSICSSVPDTTVTTDLMFHQIAPLVEGPTIIEANLMRSGARLIAVGVDVYDGGGLTELTELPDPFELPRVATGIVNFARAQSSASKLPHVADPLSFIGRRRHWKPYHELPTESLVERCGIRVVEGEAGIVELPNSTYVHNNRGRISGGVLGTVFQAAAEAAFPDFAGSDLHVHYLAPARVGPLRTSTVVVREASDHVVCQVEAIDVGADDLLVVAQATVTLQRVR
jgi:acyl-coenzyme A thioesterase PaaI-like protein